VNPAQGLAARLALLQAVFEDVAATRMAGVPVLNVRLAVQAVGFEPEAADPAVALGVLVTPWFMNLLRLPLDATAQATMAAPGAKREHDCGPHRLEFIGALEPALGRYEMSSLFSPMFEFADQAAALATAREVLAQLRPPAVPQPARRGFLFGRAAAGAAP
jgi:[NiFe] hydrogenase assembly HybE family chaperone